MFIFALVSLLLVAVGLFGVISYLASQRTTEIGVRIALGARPGHVVTLILRNGPRPASTGLVLGLGKRRSDSADSVDAVQDATLDLEIFSLVALALLVVAAAALHHPCTADGTAQSSSSAENGVTCPASESPSAALAVIVEQWGQSVSALPAAP